VRIAPTELLLRSGVATQTVSFTVTNDCLRGTRTYTLAHKPAFALDMAKDYSGNSYDRVNPDAVDPASVRLSRNNLSVAPGASATITVSTEAASCVHSLLFSWHVLLL
jgi:hypothetical protein